MIVKTAFGVILDAIDRPVFYHKISIRLDSKSKIAVSGNGFTAVALRQVGSEAKGCFLVFAVVGFFIVEIITSQALIVMMMML
jgi:hypothetical protein